MQDYNKIGFVVDLSNPIRLDGFLSKRLSRGLRYVRRIIRDGRVLVNGKKIFKKAEFLLPGDVVEVYEEQKKDRVVPSYHLRLFQGPQGLGAVYKPPFWHTQKGRSDPCVEEWLEEHIDGPFWLLNRLDYLTSGLILFSTQFSGVSSYRKLQDRGEVEKFYFALVKGHIPLPLCVKNLIDHCRRKKVKVLKERDKDRRRWSRIRPVKFFRDLDITMVEVSILKGRRHQIRAHLSYISHPIVGDPIYGDLPLDAERMYLCHYMIRSRDICFRYDREIQEWTKKVREGRL